MRLGELAKGAIKQAFRLFGLDVQRSKPEGYALFFLKPLGIKTVLDIGAHRGLFARSIRNVLPEAAIHAFEPVRKSFEELKQRAECDWKMFIYNVALGEKEEESTIEVNEFSPASSLLGLELASRKAFPYAQRTSSQAVKIIPLDDWAKEVELADPLAIKVDVQGYEDRVLRGGPETFKRASALIIEVSFKELYKGQVLFEDLHQTLYAMGFRCAGMFNNIFDKSYGILQADAIFLRKDTLK